MQYSATTATTRRKKPLTTAGKIACGRLELVSYAVWHCCGPQNLPPGLIGGRIWLARHLSDWQMLHTEYSSASTLNLSAPAGPPADALLFPGGAII